MKAVTKKYSNGVVTVVWKPHVCIHSTLCWKQLHDVFDPAKHPWINMQGAATEQIIEQVNRCPSGALSFYLNGEEPGAEEEVVDNERIIEVTANGPLLVYGNITVKDAQGHYARKSKVTAFCRCGHSHNKPYCDGSHVKADFKG